MLLPFFVLFPLVKAVTAPANDKRLSVNATVSFRLSSVVPMKGTTFRTAIMVGGHDLQTEGGKKRSVDALKRKHFKGLALFSNDPGLWPKAVVPYELVSQFNHTELGVIRYGMKAFQKHTCIRFRKRTERDMYYLSISGLPEKWCYSHVGRETDVYYRTKEGKFITELNMDPECFDGPAMIHELMHSIGFHHEHQREDRDPRVTAGPRDPDPNIDYWNRHTYSRTEAQYMGKYDTESVMHYDFDYFKPYIRTYFTQSDINNINTLYKCPMNKEGYFIKKDDFKKNPRSAPRRNAQSTNDVWSRDAIQFNTNSAIKKNSAKDNAIEMKTGKTSGRNAFEVSTSNPTKRNGAWTNAPRLIVRNNPGAVRLSTNGPTRRYFAGGSAIKNNTPFRRNNLYTRTTPVRNMWTNNPLRTNYNRNPKTTPGTNPVSWSTGTLYRRYFVGSNAMRKNTPSRKNNLHTRTTPVIKMWTKNSLRTNYNRNPKTAPGTNLVSWSTGSLYRKYFVGSNAMRKNTPFRKNNLHTRPTPVSNMWTKTPVRTNYNGNPRAAPGTNPVSWSTGTLYRRYFVGSNAMRKNTPFRKNNLHTRPTPVSNMWTKTPVRTNYNGNPRAAPGTNPVSWSTGTLYRRYVGSNAMRKNTPSRKNNLHTRTTPVRNMWTKIPVRANYNGNPRAAPRTNPVSWSTGTLYRRYFVGSNAMRKNAPSRKNNLHTRTTPVRKMWTKNSLRTNYNRNPKTAPGTNPVSWSTGSLYRRYVGSNAMRKNTPSRKNNLHTRTTPVRKMWTKNPLRTNYNRNPRAAPGTHLVTWSTGNLYGRNFPGNAIRKNTVFGRKKMASRNTPGGNATRTKNATGNYMKRNPRNAAGKKSVISSPSNLYRGYFAGNNIIRRNTPLRRKSMSTTRNASGRYAARTNKRNPRNAAGSYPAGWSSNIPNGRYSAGNKFMRKNTPSRSNNMNSKNMHGKNVKGTTNTARTNVRRNPKNAIKGNFVKWRSKRSNRRSNNIASMRRNTGFGRKNFKGSTEYISGKTMVTENNATKIKTTIRNPTGDLSPPEKI